MPATSMPPDQLLHARRVGGVVLCGGRSSRMGQPKALLPVGREVMLQRVCRMLAGIVSPIAIVAAVGQELPELSNEWLASHWPSTGAGEADRNVCSTRGSADRNVCSTGASPIIRIARDPVEYRGPLAGLAVGISQLAPAVDCVYASACDAPLLRPAFVRAMIDALGDHDIAVPFDGRFHHPLAAVYRVSVLPAIEELLAADRLRPVFLFEKCRTREVSIEDLRRADPELDSLLNTNTPGEYEQALARIAAEEPR